LLEFPSLFLTDPTLQVTSTPDTALTPLQKIAGLL